MASAAGPRGASTAPSGLTPSPRNAGTHSDDPAQSQSSDSFSDFNSSDDEIVWSVSDISVLSAPHTSSDDDDGDEDDFVLLGRPDSPIPIGARAPSSGVLSLSASMLESQAGLPPPEGLADVFSRLQVEEDESDDARPVSQATTRRRPRSRPRRSGASAAGHAPAQAPVPVPSYAPAVGGTPVMPTAAQAAQEAEPKAAKAAEKKVKTASKKAAKRAAAAAAKAAMSPAELAAMQAARKAEREARKAARKAMSPEERAAKRAKSKAASVAAKVKRLAAEALMPPEELAAKREAQEAVRARKAAKKAAKKEANIARDAARKMAAKAARDARLKAQQTALSASFSSSSSSSTFASAETATSSSVQSSPTSEALSVSFYQDAVEYISSFLSSSADKTKSKSDLTFLKALIIELGLCPATTAAEYSGVSFASLPSLPSSLRAAKTLLQERVFVNVRDYLDVRGKGLEALQSVMHPTRKDLIRDLSRGKGQRKVPRGVIKESGLGVLLVTCYR